MNADSKGADLLLLAVCAAISALLCAAQILGSRAMIGVCLIGFMGAICFAAVKKKAFPVLLYFLPWSPLLKLSYSGISFYTIALIAVCLIALVKSGFRFDAKSLITALMILALSLTVKVMDGSSITLDYIRFIFMLALFPMVVSGEMNGSDFRMSTLFLSIGIIIAGITAKYFAKYPNISRFIDVYSWSAVTRYSGYYGDANFYSAQISAALGGCLLLALSEKRSIDIALLFVPIILLTYCGFIAASKTFLLTFALMLFVWLFALMLSRQRPLFKAVAMLFIVIGVVIVFCTDLLSDSVAVIKLRFRQSTDFTSLTTHRDVLWLRYYEAITGDYKLLLLGQGLTKSLVHGSASHNTIIQIVFQLGIIGGCMLFVWMLNYYKLLITSRPRRGSLLAVLALGIGIFLPWLSIDLLMFDEFFLMPVYFCMAFDWLEASQNQPRSSLPPLGVPQRLQM